MSSCLNLVVYDNDNKADTELAKKAHMQMRRSGAQHLFSSFFFLLASTCYLDSGGGGGAEGYESGLLTLTGDRGLREFPRSNNEYERFY